jgi:hypothetical protein
MLFVATTPESEVLRPDSAMLGNPVSQSEMKPAILIALPSKVAVAGQPNRRLGAAIRQSAKSVAQ